MNAIFVYFILALLGIGVLTREGFIFVILYLFVGAFLFSYWWIRRANEKLELKRSFVDKVFVGEQVRVHLRAENHSRLPLLYVQIEDLTPPELSGEHTAQQVLSLGRGQAAEVSYQMVAHKRGLYEIGPAEVVTGDLLGLASEQRRQVAPDRITVFPRVLTLQQLGLPMQAPLGAMRHTHPIFEDPSRPIGKRDYQRGDPTRGIDWKASASAGKLQVKQYQPSIDLNTVVYLDLNRASYQDRNRFHAMEFAIVVAASVANWVTERKQAVGFVSNGRDLLAPQMMLHRVEAQKGHAHLMNVLELLARIDAADGLRLVDMLQQSAGRLSWGSTLILITGEVTMELLESLIPLKRAGLNPMVISCGSERNQNGQGMAKSVGIPYYPLRHELELDHLWRDA